MVRSSTWRWNPGQREGAITQVEIAEELPNIKLGDVPHYPLGTRHPGSIVHGLLDVRLEDSFVSAGASAGTLDAIHSP